MRSETNTEKSVGIESDVEDTDDVSSLISRGIDVIGRNDCAACHSVDKAIIGPSYTMVAQKYGSALEMIQQAFTKDHQWRVRRVG